jgi:molecular chaperone GrpE
LLETPSENDDVVEVKPEDVLVEEEEAETVEERVDELTALQQQLKAVQVQADEYLDDLRRERAAFQNYKKRQENERAELRSRAQVDVLVQLFPIIDDMERALDAVPEDQAEQPWIEGLAFIQRKLDKTLEGLGVVPIEAEPGQAFDPFVHEAVTYEENPDHKQDEIISVVQKGYKHGERVLRPALVRVAR